MTIDELKSELMKLEPSVRAEIARDLLGSLDSLSEDENVQLWIEESDRRYEQIQRGLAETVSLEEALAKAYAESR